jgi:hypothetical protein
MTSDRTDHAGDAGWLDLWAAVRPALEDHPIEAGALGEYALVMQQSGQEQAQRAFPAVAAHLRTRCERCEADLREFPFDLEPSSPFEGVRRVVATLFTPGTLAHAVRGSGATDMRSFRADGVSLSISIFGGPQAYVLEGLVAHAGAVAAAAVRLSAPGGPSFVVETDRLGNFSVADVPPGRYELAVRLADTVVVVETLSIGETQA